MELKLSHCEEVLIRPILIGSDSRLKKKFLFNAWESLYMVVHDGVTIATVYSGTGGRVDDLIDIYNRIK